MTRKKRRLMVLLLAGLGLGTATALTLTAFQDNLVFFLSPSDVMAQRPSGDRAFRLGGLVETGSVERHTGSDGRPSATFRVSDGPNAISVTYSGVLPDLFREGQGVVTLGRLLPDIERTAQLVSGISTACREQRIGVDQVNRAILEMNELGQRMEASDTGRESAVRTGGTCPMGMSRAA